MIRLKQSIYLYLFRNTFNIYNFLNVSRLHSIREKSGSSQSVGLINKFLSCVR